MKARFTRLKFLRQLSHPYIASGLGIVLSVIAIAWWGVSFYQNALWLGTKTWILAWPFLGCDFAHTYLSILSIRNQTNPYYYYHGDDRGPYSYPPLVLVEFAWCAPFPATTFAVASDIWTVLVAILIAAAAIYGNVIRERLTGKSLSTFLVCGCVLLSTPVVFAMERGNCDAIVLILIVVAAAAMQKAGKYRNIVVGLALGTAMWTKIYPGMLIVGLLPLRKYRAFAWSLFVGIAIPIILFSGTVDFFRTSGESEGYRSSFLHSALTFSADPKEAKSNQTQQFPLIEICSHSLPIYWHTFWTSMSIKPLARIPGVIGCGFIFVPLLAWICVRLRKHNGLHSIAYPYFLWVALLATFWMPVSYDYNLIFWPVMTVTIWRWRDGIIANALLLPSFLYWQPHQFTVQERSMLLIKVLMLVGLTICLGHRISELPRRVETK